MMLHLDLFILFFFLILVYFVPWILFIFVYFLLLDLHVSFVACTTRMNYSCFEILFYLFGFRFNFFPLIIISNHPDWRLMIHLFPRLYNIVRWSVYKYMNSPYVSLCLGVSAAINELRPCAPNKIETYNCARIDKGIACRFWFFVEVQYY